MTKPRRTAFWFAFLLILLAGIVIFYGFIYSPWNKRQRYVLSYHEQIAQTAQENKVDPYLVCAMIFCESSFCETAVSSVGAMGLMQIMPETGQWLAKKISIDNFQEQMLFDPETNLKMGCWYLQFLLTRYDGDTASAVAAYHAGQGRVDDWREENAFQTTQRILEVIPEGETKKYTSRVLKVYEIYQELYPDVFS